ncbi:MAG: M3 family metallopeptidase [Dehalococcoidia bacterium]
MIDFTVPSAAEIEAAQHRAIAQADAIVAGIVALQPGEHCFANTLLALEETSDLIEKVHGRYGFMSYVAGDAAVRGAADTLREALEKYEIELGFREDLYKAVTDFAETDEAQALTGEDQRLLEHTLRDFRRDGFALEPEKREQVRQLKNRLVELSVAFQRNIDVWDEAIHVDRDGLKGLPDSYIESLKSELYEGKTVYRVSLDYPEMYPFLDNAESEPLRRELMVKNYLKGGPDNVRVLEEAIGVRDELARTLGYASWAAYVLEIRMAKEPVHVTDFLAGLRSQVASKLETDLEGLRQAKREHTGDASAELGLWDWRFYHNQLMKSRYAVDDFEVAKYFPLDAVLDGLFDSMQTLLGVRFEAIEPAKTWHPDVRLYRIIDAGSGNEVAHFFMDLFPRPNKYGHAAAFTLVGGRQLADGSYQTPVSAIVANFTKPTATQPSLLRHSEVETLWHEFGHILHQTLTTARRLSFSGTRTETDFVEAPSQMLEHWIWRPEVLASFSRHVDSGEPLPQTLLDSMIAAKNLDSALFIARQLYFAELDMAYHAEGSKKDTTAIAAALHTISGFPAPEHTHWQSGFGHLFGYDAGYYGYKWSEVFADDMFTRFAAAGPLNPLLGLEYRSTVLARGGSVDGDVLVRDFLGREPNSKAFLENNGIS